jgi:lipopolysaccharide transport system ATP-binding protein
MASIKASGLTVAFPLFHGSARSLKKQVFDRTGLRRDKETTRLEVTALHNLSFEVQSGDRVALQGPNGAGKSTLLSALLGIYMPVAGCLEINGLVDGLLNISAGMDMSADAYENIDLHCLMRGVPIQKRRALKDEIAEFTELGDFLSLPLRTYSSGMMLRLAFAMKTAVAPQILLMDEWILAGDAAFVEKAEARLTGLINQCEILVLATHNKGIADKWCNRHFNMESGKLVSVTVPEAAPVEDNAEMNRAAG